MSQFKDKKIDMKELMNEICKEVKGLTQQVFLTIWEAFRKFTFQQLQLDRTIVILESFYLQMVKQNQNKIIKLMPTSTLLAEFSLTYRSDDNDITNIGSLVSVTQGNLFKYIESKDKESLQITKQNAYFIYTFIFKYLKNIIKKYKSVNLQLDFLGSIIIYERTFIHQPELKNANNEKIKVKQLIEKESVQNFSDLKRQSLLIKSKQNLLERTKSNLINSSSFSSLKLNDQSYFQTSQQFRRKLSPQYINEPQKKRPLFHDMVDSNKTQSFRITNDLLGAGIDPLTYDYKHSKMVEDTSELFCYKFQKPQKAKTRLPGLIDKFSRTIGAQLTGAKVSTSSSIRIGSNYSPCVKNFYIDLTMKQIMRVPQQITIKLTEKPKICPATEDQQYEFVLYESQIEGDELQQKVKLRKKTFQRYQEYCMKQIPNECVAPLSREVLKNIADKIKEIVKSLGKVQGKQIFDKLLNEVNRFYYISGKKAIVDYILKDESQKNRTGISIAFKAAHDWGVVNPGQFFPEIRKQNTIRKRIILQSQFLIYPDLILEIVKHNQMVDTVSPFNIDLPKNYRPMNVLYHLKKHSNNFTEIMKFLNQKWVKGAVQIITKNKNWKKQNVRNFNIFMNNVHTLMSNKLKDLVSRTLQVFTVVNTMFDYENPPAYPKPVLYLHLGEQNRRIIFMDDLNNIYKKQVSQVHKSLLKSLSEILSPQCYIKQGQEKFLWSIDPNDINIKNFNQRTDKIIQRNYEETEKIKIEMKKFQKIYHYKDDLIQWTKAKFQPKQLDIKLRQLKKLQNQIDEIPFFRKTLVAVVDCHELKKKLHYEIKLMRYYLFQCIQNLVKKVDSSITERIKSFSQQISKEIKNTADYVELSKLISLIKSKQLIEISQQISQNQKLLMKLFTIQNCFVSHDLLKEIYHMQKSLASLKDQVDLNEERILKERSQLQKTLKQRISNFQTLTVTQLREINLKIDSFEVRKLYTEYLVYLTDFRQKSQKNMKQMLILNHQEDDLKWASTTFSSAIELQNLIAPNFQLWRLVQFYDQNVRQWKHLQLCNFDIEKTESRMVEIDTGITKIINKLKNFSSLKIAHELQNDVKQVINRQLQIIKIFSHPGLKERHWHLFSKKLTIPGYDLKQITYGRIKILYDYEKNLKVLSSISNQAAKQFEIENEKNQMSSYWYSLNCEIRTDNVDQQLVFIQQDFLNLQISCVEDHLMRTAIIKNSPFSKALNQMLTDWENYLLTAKTILIGFKNSQQGFLTIKDIFKIDDISKYLPIQNTEFESIENIWKSVIKKVLQQPKISQLFKSQKITQILDEITKKSNHIKSSLPIFLHSKRVQFPRFFFVNDSDLIEIFSSLNKGSQRQALSKIAKSCFNGLETIQKIDKGYRMRSPIDYMDVIIEKPSNSKKHKIRVIQDVPSILTSSKQKIKTEIKSILGTQNLSDNQSSLSKYTVTALLAAEHFAFSQRLIELKNQSVQSSQKNWKQVQKYSRQIIEFIESKQRQVNMNQVRKTDFIVLRKLSNRQVLNFLLRKNDGVIDSFQLNSIPILRYKDNSMVDCLVLEISGFTIDYDYEYIGEDVLAFHLCGTSSNNLTHQLLKNINSGDITILNSKDMRIATRMLSQMSGTFYKQIDFISYLSSNSNGIYQLLAGLVSSDVWINLNMDNEGLLKIASENLSLISEIVEQKRAKILQNSDYLIIKENQIPIHKGNAVFFYLDSNISSQLPDRLFSGCRSLNFAGPESFQTILMQFLSSNDIFLNWQTISMIKMVIQILRNLHPESKINIDQVLEIFNSIVSNVEQSENTKTKKIVICKMLEKIFTNETEQKSIRNLFKLQTKEIEGDIHLKKQKEAQISQIKLGFEKFFDQKIQELDLQSKFYDKVIIYGTYGHKTSLIQSYLKKMYFSFEQCQQITINTSFISAQNTQNLPSVNFLIEKSLKSYEKASRMSSVERINPIIFDGLIDDQKLKIIQDSLQNHKNKKPQKPISCFIECQNLHSLSPQTTIKMGKVFMNNYQMSDRGLYEQWAQKLSLKPQQIEYVKSLGLYLQGIVDLILKNKHILLNLNRDYPIRYVLIKSFLKFYEIYLMNLNTKQVQALPQFDVENYILNSFVFAAYWSLGVGFAFGQSKRTFEVYLKETFGSQYDIPHCIEDFLLNEENQWVSWENLKQEFSPEKQSDLPLCSLWVPTIQNTKFYTIIIKLLEKDLPLLLLGSQSGKSTLLKQIPNFQITYSTFIIDCNKLTNIFRVGKLIKERVVYGDEKKLLVMVDDLHLPLKSNQMRINELLLQIVKTSSIPTFSQFGTVNQKLKKSNILLSANLSQQSTSFNDPSMWRLISRFQPLNLKRIDEKQLQCIFKPYLSYFFNHNDFQGQQLRLQGSIMLILVRIFDCQKFLRLAGKEFIIDVSDIKKIVDSVCRLNPEQYKDKFQILSYFIYEAHTLLSSKIELSSQNSDKKHSEAESYRHFKKTLETQHTKFCNPEKNIKQFDNLLCSYIYRDIPFYDTSVPLDKNQMKSKMINHLKIKSFDHPFVLTIQLINTIQKIMHFLHATPSHILFVAPKRSGARSLINIVSKLKNLNYIELGTSYHVEQFLQEVIKILKTGGKIDECICCLPNDKEKQDEFLGIVNSLISSAEFYQSLSQIQLQQIIKSFNSQKKVLKKDIKKSEIIKKIKEKLNSIFHFVVCIEQGQLQQIYQKYPCMIRDSFIYLHEQWSEQATVQIFSIVLQSEKDEVKKITKTFQTIYGALSNDKKQEIQTQQFHKSNQMDIISLMQIYDTFSKYFQKLQQTNSQSINIWQKKITTNQTKLQQLYNDRSIFQQSNKSRFSQIQELKSVIEQKSQLLKAKRLQFKQIEQNHNKVKDNMMSEKSTLFIENDTIAQRIHEQIDKQKTLQIQTQTMNIKDCQQNGLLQSLIERYEVIHGKEQLSIDDIGQLLDEMRKQQGFECLIDYCKGDVEVLKSQLNSSQTTNIIISPLQKSFLTIIISMWQQITDHNRSYQQFATLQHSHKQSQQHYFKHQSLIRSIEDEIEQSKQQIQQLTQKNSKLIDVYEEIKAKIAHLQQLLQIMMKLKSTVVEGKRGQGASEEKQLGLEDQQVFGLIMLLTVCLKQHISNTESKQFKAIKTTLSTLLNIQISQKHILSALPIQQRIQIQYCLNDNSFQSILNYLIIELSPVYCTVIDHEKEIESYLKRWGRKIISYLQAETVEEFKSLIMVPGYVVVTNPSEQFVEEIKVILTYPRDRVIGTQFTGQINQFTIHQQTKIIFLYESKQNVNPKIASYSQWVCEINHSPYVKKIVQNFLCRLTSSRDTEHLALMYAEKHKQLQTLGERMHGLVIKMKKDNLNSQQIQQRISQVNSHKVSIEKDLKNFKSELKQIFNPKPQLNKHIQLIVSLYNTYKIRLNDLLFMIKDLYKNKQKHFHKSLEQVSNMIQFLIKRREKKLQQKIQLSSQRKKLPQNATTKDKLHSQKQKKPVNQQQMKSAYNNEMNKVNLNLLTQFTHMLSNQNHILRTDQPSILKKCLANVIKMENLPLIERRISEINSITFMPNLWILTEIKCAADWSELHTLLKSIKDKKLSIRLLILSPFDIKVPNYVREIKEFSLASLFMFLVKMMYQSIDQPLMERGVGLFYELFVEKNSNSKYEKLAILERELVVSNQL